MVYECLIHDWPHTFIWGWHSWASVTVHIKTWRIFCCHRGRHLTMGNISPLQKGGIFWNSKTTLLVWMQALLSSNWNCPPAKTDHFLILGEQHVFDSPSFCFWNVSPLALLFFLKDAFTSTASNTTLAFRLSSILAVQLERNLFQVRPLDFGLVLHSYLVRRG